MRLDQNDEAGHIFGKRTADERVFLEFYYPNVKDLAKHFLTLISGSLVFSITFSEKIIDFDHAHVVQQASVILAWFLLIGSLGMCGYGLYLSFLAAEQASGSLIYDYKLDFKEIARKSYCYLDWAGFVFGAGLCLLVVTAILNFRWTT